MTIIKEMECDLCRGVSTEFNYCLDCGCHYCSNCGDIDLMTCYECEDEEERIQWDQILRFTVSIRN